jgi:pimeloyl-ACP methyl ester carboxylesterase
MATVAEESLPYQVVPVANSAGAKPKAGCPRCCVRATGCVCCVLLVIFIAAYIYVLELLTDMAIDRFVIIDEDRVEAYIGPDMTQENLVVKTWWPGCGIVNSLAEFEETGCGSPCFSAELMKEMHAFNGEHPGKLVSYSSRDHEGVQKIALEGWWLPAPSEKSSDVPAPRIVLQHGFQANSNYFRPLLAAYMLRRLGFSVLVNNFRDHGYSDNSSVHIDEWGDAYPYDLLGAWDYARTDPDGVLGGEMPSDKVGIQGFSKGAFTCLNAFGLEEDVPAAWVDSPPFTPKVVFAHGARKQMAEMGIAFMAPLLVDPVWDRVEDEALSRGVDLNENLPEKVLPRGPDRERPVYVVGNEDDDTVPIGELERLLTLLEEYPAKYRVSSWVTEGSCHGEDHCAAHLKEFDEYSKRMCEFWKSSFGISTESC